MFIELVDALRCPRAHADSWMVAAALETHDRCLVRGTLGCPVCRAEYAVVGGVVEFGATMAPSTAHLDAPIDAPPDAPPDAPADEALRLAALLDLSSAGGIVAVGGVWDRALDVLCDAVDVRVLVVEPSGRWQPREPLGAVRGADLPVAVGSLRGVALDARTAGTARLAAAVRALRPRGRLVAPVTAAVPVGVRELARDGRHWVAERDAVVVGALIPLRRA